MLPYFFCSLLVIPLLLYFFLAVVAPSAVMQLSRGLPMVNSPGKPGKTVFCERVHIYGLSRIKNLSKFAHSVTVKVLGRNSSAYLPNAEVCFHR